MPPPKAPAAKPRPGNGRLAPNKPQDPKRDAAVSKLEGDTKVAPKGRGKTEKPPVKCTTQMAVQWTIAVVLIISSGICIFFAIDFKKIGQITKKIMSATDEVTNMTFIYFRTNETWKGLTQMRFKGMLGTYAKFILDPRALVAAKVENDGGTGLKPAFWFCSAGDFKRIYNNFVDAVDFVDKVTWWRLPAKNADYPRGCAKINFK